MKTLTLKHVDGDCSYVYSILERSGLSAIVCVVVLNSQSLKVCDAPQCSTCHLFKFSVTTKLGFSYTIPAFQT